MSAEPALGSADRPPMLAIDGNATPEEVAAVVAVLAGTAAAAASATSARPRSLWADPARGVRRTPESTPGAGLWPGSGGSSWRASALPR